jgi:imidazolonepropionase
VFGGTRADEHAMRRAGASYEDIAQAGGGIASTVAATRAASDDELRARLAGLLRECERQGTTTVEV